MDYFNSGFYDYNDLYDYAYDSFGDDFGNSAEVNSGEVKSMAAQVGTRFTTGNAVVADLAVGTLLEVVDAGEIEIVDVPAQEFNEGDRIYTKHGASTVVRLSSHFDGLNGFDPETQVLYISDDSSVVRRADKSDVSSL